jgi:hypothetical protein
MATVEFGNIADMDDPTATLECVCYEGRLVGHQEGFFPATADGFIVSDKENSKHPWPVGERYVHALCSACGRLYSDAEIVETGEARVMKVIDLDSPEHKKDVEEYLA